MVRTVYACCAEKTFHGTVWSHAGYATRLTCIGLMITSIRFGSDVRFCKARDRSADVNTISCSQAEGGCAHRASPLGSRRRSLSVSKSALRPARRQSWTRSLWYMSALRSHDQQVYHQSSVRGRRVVARACSGSETAMCMLSVTSRTPGEGKLKQ